MWEEYASETRRAQTAVDGIDEPHDGGRGYYRPVSLLSVWAYAPFMHNNAIGPEVCGAPSDPRMDFYAPPYVLPGSWERMKNPPACWPYDPSVEGRYRLFKASMMDLLNPGQRVPKISLTDEPVIIDGPQFGDSGAMTLQIPAGVPAAFIGNLRHKVLVRDLTWAKVNPARLRAEYTKTLGAQEAEKVAVTLEAMLKELLAGVATNRENAIREVGRQHLDFIKRHYSNSTAEVENEGHTFGQGLSARDKQALIAFLATL